MIKTGYVVFTILKFEHCRINIYKHPRNQEMHWKNYIITIIIAKWD